MANDAKYLFDRASLKVSRTFTYTYSTSFSLAIRCLQSDLHRPIHAIYGFVRLADEVVDSFHQFNKAQLLAELRADTKTAIEQGISLNPILNSFQWAVNKYHIEWDLIDKFLRSMEMDLHDQVYDQAKFNAYILGSAEVVGLMCLRVFCDGDNTMYNRLKAPAMRLGAAFQKVNFLRDLKADHQGLGRTYFPDVEVGQFDRSTKLRIENEMEADFDSGLEGILQLPRNARFGVYLAYVYYWALFKKIKSTPPAEMLERRIRISNPQKFSLLATSLVRHKLNLF